MNYFVRRQDWEEHRCIYRFSAGIKRRFTGNANARC